ncbi:MAG: hypothetical protein HC817_09005 [Saprospiraceae bacterium]|nr:hypothetical protein [Saprospiraceae bacterium]
MGYSNYKKIKTVVKKFNLDMRLVNLFEPIQPVQPSAWLLESLDMAEVAPLTNEKSKSERIVSPILLEVAKHYRGKISLFSGEDLNVKSEDDLSGPCDFFFSLQAPKLYVEAPIISLAESKDEDMEWGIAQCAAQMYGAKLYNEMEGKDIPILYGCATDGIEWRFLKFENSIFYIDNKTMTDLTMIIGTWHHLLRSYSNE